MPRILYLSLEILHLKIIIVSRSFIIEQQRIAPRFTSMNNFSHLCRRWSGTWPRMWTNIYFFSRRISGVPLKRIQKHSQPWKISLSAVNDWVLATNGTLFSRKYALYVAFCLSISSRLMSNLSVRRNIGLLASLMTLFKNCANNIVCVR